MRGKRAILRGSGLALLPLAIATAFSLFLGVPGARHPVSAYGYTSQPDGSASREALLDRLWWGTEFARQWRAVSRPTCDSRTEEDAARAILRVLDDLPPPILQAIVDARVQIVLHEGNVARLEENADLRGDPEYEDTVGLYRTSRNTAYVQTDRPLRKVRHTLLHELAHALDARAGDIADEDEFKRVYEADDAVTDLGYPETVAEHKRTGEYFAESFADWFLRREMLRAERRAAARYMADYESTLTRRHYRRTERLTERAAAKRARERRQAASETGSARAEPAAAGR